MKFVLVPWGVTSLLVLGIGCDDWEQEEMAAIEADEGPYDALVVSLASRRTALELGELSWDTLRVYGRSIYDLSGSPESAVLTRLDLTTDARVEYGFAPGVVHIETGGVDTAMSAFRASDTHVVTPRGGASVVTYAMYDAAYEDQLIGEVTLNAPTGGDRDYWLYDLSDETLFVLATEPEPVIMRWREGEALTEVAQVDSLNLSFETPPAAFSVSSEDAAVVLVQPEGAEQRLWFIDLDSSEASEVPTAGAVTVFSIGDSGVIFQEANDDPTLTQRVVKFYDPATGEVRNLSAEVEASGFQVNDTFASTLHLPVINPVLLGQRLYYGQYGVFYYDLVTRTIAPVVLPERNEDNRFVWEIARQSGSGYYSADFQAIRLVGDNALLIADEAACFSEFCPYDVRASLVDLSEAE